VRRGDIVTAALQGSHGKPRPALIVQSDATAETSHVALLLLTSLERDAPLLRIAVPAGASTGLRETSFIMIDRITTAPRMKIGSVIGRIDDPTMATVNRSLALMLGLA
jgi:mRNA interferase MazF